jgi:chromosomal replication initiation ATPase DnaA
MTVEPEIIYGEQKIMTPYEKTMADVKAIAEQSGIAWHEVMGRSRFRHVVRVRAAICVALRERGWSFPRIGAFLGLDHTTVMHHCSRAKSGN